MDTLSLAPPFLKVNTNYMLRKIPYQTIYNYIQYFYIITSVELDAKDESGHNKTGQNKMRQSLDQNYDDNLRVIIPVRTENPRDKIKEGEKVVLQ